MKKRISIKLLRKELDEFKKRYLKRKQFPSFPRPYISRMQPIMHTGYLMFIRNKFLFLGLLKSIEERNLYVSYSILKSYWENVASCGYYYLMISGFLKEGKEEEAFQVSMKMGLGGRGFLKKEMVQKWGDTLEDFTIPSISKMMNIVDGDWKKTLGPDSSLFKGMYDEHIAESGHTTYTGLIIAGKWLPNRSQLPDVRKSWDRREHLPLLNLVSLSSIVFFYYWEKYLKMASEYILNSITQKKL